MVSRTVGAACLVALLACAGSVKLDGTETQEGDARQLATDMLRMRQANARIQQDGKPREGLVAPVWMFAGPDRR